MTPQEITKEIREIDARIDAAIDLYFVIGRGPQRPINALTEHLAALHHKQEALKKKSPLVIGPEEVRHISEH